MLTQGGLAALLPVLVETVPAALHEQALHVLFNATSLKDAPMLAGSLQKRIDPAKCHWRVVKGEAVGTIAVDVIELTLAKERWGNWDDLFERQYV